MYPTLPNTPHRTLILRLPPLSSPSSHLRRNDLILYRSPILTYVYGGKRLIGLPGDYVCADEAYSTDIGGKGRMVRVPEGHVWVSGDNLGWSRDSREVGPVPMGLVVGRILGTWGDWGMGWKGVGVRRGEGEGRMCEGMSRVVVEKEEEEEGLGKGEGER